MLYEGTEKDEFYFVFDLNIIKGSEINRKFSIFINPLKKIVLLRPSSQGLEQDQKQFQGPFYRSNFSDIMAKLKY